MAKTKESVLASQFVRNLFLRCFKVLHFVGGGSLNLYFAIRRLSCLHSIIVIVTWYIGETRAKKVTVVAF